MKTPKGRIVCTEDDPDTRDLFRLILGKAGFEVVCCNSAEETIDLATRLPVDLFLLDNWLPKTSGLELCRLIRAAKVETPILFCSGVGDALSKQHAIEAGAQGYLVKPVLPEDLLKVVSHYIVK